MSYKEWFERMCSRFGISAEDAEFFLASNPDMIPDPEAEADSKVAMRVLYDEFEMLMPLASSVSEGGYTVSWNWNAIKAWRTAVARKLGLNDPSKPLVRNRSDLW